MSKDDEEKPAQRDWRDERAYDDNKMIDRRGFAWEFQRRDPRYRRPHHRLRDSADDIHKGIPLIRALSPLPDFRGLLFRRAS